MNYALVTAADDAFALPASVMIRSVADNVLRTRPLDVFVLDCGISGKSRSKMRASVSKAWISLHFIPIPKEKIVGFRVDGHIAPAAYARLFMGEWLPSGIERIIYADGDMVVLTDIAALGEMDLHGRPMAAVQDPVAGLVGQSAQMMHWDGWDVPMGTRIFNSGLMVLNLPLWRQERLFERAIEVACRHPERMQWHDQDALNYVLRGNYYELDPAWNVLPFVFYPPHNRDVVYDPEAVARCIRDPKIIHYGGTWRPWKGPGRHWREAEFYRYLHRTAWRNDVYCAPWMGRGNTVWTRAKRLAKNALGR